MNGSIFVEVEFFALLFFSLLIPIGIYCYMLRRKSISRKTVLSLGVVLILISGADIYLLQQLKRMAVSSPSLLDDKIFASEISIALYLVPAIFAGIAVNVISHVLISHLTEAERQFNRDSGARR